MALTAEGSAGARLNAFLDGLPRPRLGSADLEASTFRTCGTAGAVVGMLAGSALVLATTLSLVVFSALALLSISGFFGWAWARSRLSGRETLVLLEHVWLSLSIAAVFLLATREPVYRYLDALSVSLAVFLAFGRVGCLLVGCCRGRPAGLGIRYPQSCAVEGFPRELVGVRLFPVQAVEAVSLLAIAGIGAWLVATGPGHALAWFLSSYALVRFGLEQLRAERRRTWLGLSLPRWMCAIQLAVALALTSRPGRPDLAGWTAIALVSLSALVVYLRRSRRRRLLSRRHLAELSELVRGQVELASSRPASQSPQVRSTSEGVRLAVSERAAGLGDLHLSISLPPGSFDLQLLAELACAATPEVVAAAARIGESRVLHVPVRIAGGDGHGDPRLATSLYHALIRQHASAQAIRASGDPSLPSGLEEQV